MTGLPPGWDLQRIRAMEPLSELLIASEHHVYYQQGQELETLKPACIISFSGLCLVRPIDEADWYMGDLDTTDGSIVCWASYGSDLAEAIRAL